jgi:hypothetical protein
MTPPWRHPPEARMVAVVQVLQELVCVTDPSELRAVLGGAQGQARRRWSPTGPGGTA